MFFSWWLPAFEHSLNCDRYEKSFTFLFTKYFLRLSWSFLLTFFLFLFTNPKCSAECFLLKIADRWHFNGPEQVLLSTSYSPRLKCLLGFIIHRKKNNKQSQKCSPRFFTIKTHIEMRKRKKNLWRWSGKIFKKNLVSSSNFSMRQQTQNWIDWHRERKKRDRGKKYLSN